jgi:hypothetical protein
MSTSECHPTRVHRLPKRDNHIDPTLTAFESISPLMEISQYPSVGSGGLYVRCLFLYKLWH